MLLIAIDGACRRNGKPDCISAGGVFIQHYKMDKCVSTNTLASYEMHSTNQRGEMHALIQALEYVFEHKEDAQIVTDSEYLFNAMKKDWLSNWFNKGWITATGDPVKNKDLWEKIHDALYKCIGANIEVLFYHIKGHVIPFGKVTANTLLTKDPSGLKLLNEVAAKYLNVCDTTKKENIEKANRLSLKNNEFMLPKDKLCKFIVANTVVDAVATKCVETADLLCNR